MADMGCVWLFSRKIKVPCARGFAYGLYAARPLSVTQSAAAAAVCGAIQVMGLYLYLLPKASACGGREIRHE